MDPWRSESIRLLYDQIGLVPLLVVLLSFAGVRIWHQRGRIQILLDRLNLSDQRLRLIEERKSFSEEKWKDAEKELEHLRLKSRSVRSRPKQTRHSG